MAKPPTLAQQKAARARKRAGIAARANVGAPAPNALANAAPVKQPRVDGVDAARGVAILAMLAYHFCFDLRFYGLTHTDFEHAPFWLTARSLIVTSFLLVVGISAVLARGATADDARRGVAKAMPDPRLRRYLRRTAIVAACAAAVTAGSYLLFPHSFIYFGILHGIVLMSLLAWPFTSRPRAALVVGVFIIVLGVTASNAFFDTRLLSIVGFMTHKPVTEDYVPLFPWTGVVLVGVMLGSLLHRRAYAPLAVFARLPRFVGFLGRHSLAVYMTHQLVLLGGLWLVLRIAGRQ